MHDLRLVFAFAFHTIAGTALFALIGGAAALLNMYTHVLERVGMSPLVVQSIHVSEYLLFALDLLCFVIYVTREAYVLIVAIFSHSQNKNMG